jgi:phosphoribosylaminoimidazole carboxylase (NCAIR synthetase)
MCAELIVADYENEAALAHFIEGLDVVTYEFESIPSLRCDLLPSESRFAVGPCTRDGAGPALEKQCFERLGIPQRDLRLPSRFQRRGRPWRWWAGRRF